MNKIVCFVYMCDQTRICLVMQVYCMGHCFDKRLQPYDDDDNASILMKFPSGATSIIELSRFSNCGFDQRFMVHGDQKSAGSYSLPKDGYLEMTNQQGVSKSCLRFDFQRRFERAYVEEWKHLHLCLVGAYPDYLICVIELTVLHCQRHKK